MINLRKLKKPLRYKRMRRGCLVGWFPWSPAARRFDPGRHGFVWGPGHCLWCDWVRSPVSLCAPELRGVGALRVFGWGRVGSRFVAYDSELNVLWAAPERKHEAA